MMNFVDISNWQEGLDVNAIPVDAVICKATEGTYFVDRTCEPFVQAAKRRGIKWGFYHFAAEGDPVAEADFFIDATLGYFGEGIPVLDWETTQSVDWVNRFVNRVHDRMGVWPWIYANPWRFNQGGVEGNCARWAASYPNHLLYPDFNANEGEPPSVDGNLVAWQFASDGRLPGYGGNLDMNRFYGTAEQWDAYARGDNKAPDNPAEPPVEPQPPTKDEHPPSVNPSEIAKAVADELAARLKE